MKKSMKVFVFLMIVICLAIIFAWPYLKLSFVSSAYYTEQDKREYAYYTPDLLKNMPRISENYSFEFGNISGPQASVFTIRFYGATDNSKIRNYLASVGYKPQAQCDVEAECWRTPQSNDVVTLIRYPSPDSVVVQIYRSPNTL